MQKNSRRALTFIAGGLALLSAASADAGPFSSVFVFGDSLSDNGNLAEIQGANFPNPPFFNDSVTNGPVAVALLAQRLGLDERPSLFANGFTDTHNLFGPGFQFGTNYAIAGAKTFAPGQGDLTDQIGGFLARPGGGGLAPSDALYVVFIGGNDVRTDAAAGTNPTAANSLTARGVANELSKIQALIADGAKNILVAGVGDVGAIPESKQRNDAAAATADSIAYNKALTAGLAPIAALNTGVHLDFFDFFDFSHDLTAKLNAEGVDTSVDDFCYNNVNGAFTGAGFTVNPVCGPNASNINNLAFWDNIHPTAIVQAENALGLIAAVPEPASLALLGVSVLGLGVARRRQRQN